MYLVIVLFLKVNKATKRPNLNLKKSVNNYSKSLHNGHFVDPQSHSDIRKQEDH